MRLVYTSLQRLHTQFQHCYYMFIYAALIIVPILLMQLDSYL
jgi:hypothetical protein